MSLSFNKKNAYTLSQHMTALLIIFLILFGGIASPLYNLVQKKQTVARLRLVYAEIVQAKKSFEITNEDSLDIYDTSLPAKEFAETYFSSMSTKKVCESVQSKCWKKLTYKDLSNSKMANNSEYSMVLENGTVFGFGKPDENTVSLLVDLNGPSGVNKLGRDMFVFYFTNDTLLPSLCSKEEYKKKHIRRGLHVGGYDKCGFPHDSYSYFELLSKSLDGGCNKKGQKKSGDFGLGAACSAVIYLGNWDIERNYPW
ncbi:hypothetical protein HDR58_05395 [bacterium]|nr:hypothetical protein [bacterium]